LSSEKGYLETVRTLLEYGADVGDTDKVRNQMMIVVLQIIVIITYISYHNTHRIVVLTSHDNRPHLISSLFFITNHNYVDNVLIVSYIIIYASVGHVLLKLYTYSYFHL